MPWSMLLSILLKNALAALIWRVGARKWFCIQAGIPIVEEAARIGLQRFKGGEKTLASQTLRASMLAANFISSILIIYLLWVLIFWYFILLAVLAAQLLANLWAGFSKYITTSTEVQGMEIVRGRRAPCPKVFWEALDLCSGAISSVAGNYVLFNGVESMSFQQQMENPKNPKIDAREAS